LLVGAPTDFGQTNRSLICFAQQCGKGIPLVFFSTATDGDGHGFNLQGALFVAPVPLPAALPLFGSGVIALAGVAWRRRGKVSA
jgi:hypothetical protein